MSIQDHAADFAFWFRHAAPYIRAHRGRTFVIVFGGEAMRSPRLPDLVHDVALLHSLGIRLVLVAGSRPQIESRLAERNLTARIHEGLRITDAPALIAAKEAAGENRVELERLLTMALPGSPMAGARVRVASGNFVTARPVGVLGGVDYGSTGHVRRIDAEAIRQRLDDEAIVILTPLGYSLTGEAFNLSTPDLASRAAAALGADKLIALVEGETPGESELSIEGARSWPAKGDLRQHLDASVQAVSLGVERAHLIQRTLDGALLRELFTRKGVGTLIASAPTEAVRRARAGDVPGLLALLEPLAVAGQLVNRPRQVLERDLEGFLVIARDENILACAALREFEDGSGELECLAVSEDHRAGGHGRTMVAAVVQRARECGLKRLFVLTTQSAHWFVEQGFEACDPEALPASRGAYNSQRASKVLMLRVD
ncbi:MAG: amino-acid N-acetyltransferase [Polyangiales bacterium]|jgi:amino-acid N-acetyltransferase